MTPEVRRNATKPRVKGWYIDVHGRQPHEGHRRHSEMTRNLLTGEKCFMMDADYAHCS